MTAARDHIEWLLGDDAEKSPGAGKGWSVADAETAVSTRDNETASEFIPERYRKPLVHVIDGAMPDDFVDELGRWLYYHRAQFVRGGDTEGVQRFNYELCDLDRHAPELLTEFKRLLAERLTEGCEACGVDPQFELRYTECHATLYHHGSHFCWHDDAPGYDGEFVPSRRLTFCYYVHHEPKMFSGGELEFLDGTTVEPKNNRLVFFHPLQQHRVRAVECWSAHVLHGRWALMGWLHGDPPADYSPAALRGTPKGG